MNEKDFMASMINEMSVEEIEAFSNAMECCVYCEDIEKHNERKSNNE